MIDFKKLMLEEKKKILLEKKAQDQQSVTLNNINNNNSSKDNSNNHSINNSSSSSSNNSNSNNSSNNNNNNSIDNNKLKKVNFEEINIENFNQLKNHQFGNIESIFYIEEFINQQEEKELLKNIYSEENKDKWTQLKRRRLQNWGGNPVSSGMVEEELPQWLVNICDKVYDRSIFPVKANHVLLNEYNVNEGILPHKDGPLFFPCVCILSLNSTCLMDFYKDIKQDPVQKIFLKPRSLLIFTQDAYKNYFHGIKESYSDIITDNVINSNSTDLKVGNEIDRDIRLSLTIRIVPNTIQSSIQSNHHINHINK